MLCRLLKINFEINNLEMECGYAINKYVTMYHLLKPQLN